METLCRVTFNGYLFDKESYLLTHQSKYEYSQYKVRKPPIKPDPIILTDDMKRWLPLVPSHDYRRVSLVDSCEWETIARFLTVTRPENGPFRVLTIDKSQIEALENISHPALIKGEYFGKVPQKAIITDEGYNWVKGGRKINLTDKGIEFICSRLPDDAVERLHTFGLEKIGMRNS